MKNICAILISTKSFHRIFYAKKLLFLQTQEKKLFKFEYKLTRLDWETAK